MPVPPGSDFRLATLLGATCSSACHKGNQRPSKCSAARVYHAITHAVLSCPANAWNILLPPPTSCHCFRSLRTNAVVALARERVLLRHLSLLRGYSYGISRCCVAAAAVGSLIQDCRAASRARFAWSPLARGSWLKSCLLIIKRPLFISVARCLLLLMPRLIRASLNQSHEPRLPSATGSPAFRWASLLHSAPPFIESRRSSAPPHV